jgi:hypothetical protein
MSADKRRVHVFRHGCDWATKREGSARVARTFWTRDEAIENGRQQAARDRVQLIVHRDDGTVEQPEGLVPAG